MNICQKCNNPIPSTLTIGGRVFDLSKRHYCTSCFKFTERKCEGDMTPKASYQSERFCPKCQRVRPIIDFLYLKRQRRYMWRCRDCSAEIQAQKIKEFKRKCMEYKGGSCKSCGYNKCTTALDFHHRNADEKEFNIGSIWFRGFDKAKVELDKCDLLCSNCHRELHDNLSRA